MTDISNPNSDYKVPFLIVFKSNTVTQVSLPIIIINYC